MFTALLFSIFAHAGAPTQICSLSGEVDLQAPSKIFCMKDMTIADGTRIITQGYPLEITVVGNIYYGEPLTHGRRPPRHPGLRIDAFKPPAPQSQSAGPIFIYSHTAFGSLEIDNRGASEKDLSGDVAIEYVARGRGYSQTIQVTPGRPGRSDRERLRGDFRQINAEAEPNAAQAGRPAPDLRAPQVRIKHARSHADRGEKHDRRLISCLSLAAFLLGLKSG